MKTAELTGALLDYWVARAEGHKVDATFTSGLNENLAVFIYDELTDWTPSTNWAQGGPIVEREKIGTVLAKFGGYWYAAVPRPGTALGSTSATGPTPLQAAMRAYVASKFGDEVPDGALEGDAS
jgi:hypothetical protein